jgi:arsenate reductase
MGVITMYGIRNCDTVKKARAWLERAGVAYEFHDYKTAGIDRVRLQSWCKEHGWEALLNRSGTSFRKLADIDKTDLTEARALKLMLANPSLIRRPVLDIGKCRLVGFKPGLYDPLK